MPGIETAAPERTETSSGFDVSPKARFVSFSSVATLRFTSSIRPAGSLPDALYAAHCSVVMVKPGGTGRPIELMSARFAPLPPRS